MLRLLDRYLPPSYRAVFQDEFTWRDNPVLRREQLREGRRRDRALLLLVMFATLLGAFTASVWALDYFHHLRAFRERVPPVFGGGYPVAFFALFSGIHVWFVWHAAYRRSTYMLLQEYRQNSLFALLCTRISPFQLLLMAALHPFRQGMLVAAAGLPFYAWIMGLGGVTATEFLGLYLLFAMISFRPPRWSLPVFAGVPAEEILKRQRGGRPKTWGEWWLINAFWILMIASWYLQWAFGPQWLMKVLWPLGSLFTGDVYRILPGFMVTWVLALVRFLWHPLPYFGFHLPPIAMVLPLYLFARLMGIWESSIQLRTGDADTTQSLWDIGEYWRMRRIFGVALPFLALGFLWEPYVASGLTSVLLVIRGGQKDVAIAGLLYVAGCMAALVCWARAREMGAVRAAYGGRLMGWKDGEVRELSAAWEAWYVLSPVVTIYALYGLACVLAGVSPFPAAAVRLIAPLLLVTLAGAIYARGVPPGLRNYVLALTLPLAGWLLPVPEVGGYIAALSPLAALLSLTEHTQRILNEIPITTSPVAAWYIACTASVAAGVVLNMLLSGKTRAVANVGLEPGSPISPLPATIPSPVSVELAMARQPAAPSAINTSIAAASESDLAIPPVVAQPSLPPSAETAPLKAKPFLRKKDTPQALRLIAWLQGRWDNAVAVKELRVLLRGHLGKDEQIAITVVLVGFLLAALYRADISMGVLEGPARVLFGPSIAGGGPMFSGSGSPVVVFGGLAAVLLLLMTFIATASSVGICGTAFGRERDKSTLGFVLVTPLPTVAILMGKLLGMLFPVALAVLLITLWCALLCVPVALVVGVGPTVTGLLFGLAVCMFLSVLGGSLGVALSTVFRRESDATSMAFLLLFATLAGITYMTIVWPHLLVLGIRDVGDAPRQWIWLAYLALANLFIVPALLGFTHWRLSRARHGDVAFESAK